MKVERVKQSACLRDSGLSEKIFDMALVCGDQEEIIDSDGGRVDWLLDLRIPLLDGNVAGKLGNLIADRVRLRGCKQVAGHGLGGSTMVCAAIHADGYPYLRGGVIRSHRKSHGRRRLLEGPLDTQLSVVLLDDLLNSGTTALHALKQLRQEGFCVVGYITIFEFTWGEGRKRLEGNGIWVDALMELALKRNKSGSSDSAMCS